MRISVAIILSCLTILVGCSKQSVQKSNVTNTNAETSASALPSGRGTAAEAKAMTLMAVEHYGAVGRSKALADFTTMKSPFGDRDLYVVCMDSERKISAHGGYAQYVGQSSDVWKDADGKSLGQAVWEQAWTSGEAMIEYKWTNPVSKLTEKKTGYFKKVGEDICGVSAYTD